MKLVTKMVCATGLLIGMAGGIAEGAVDPLLKQDPEVLRFVERSLAWYPASTFTVVADDRSQTPSGSYRVVRVARSCDNPVLAGEPSVVVDEVTGQAYLGSVGELPFEQTGVAPRSLRSFLEGFLPEVLDRNMNMKVRVSWDLPEGAKPGAVIPFTLMIDTGYGEFPKPTAVTSDGRLLVMAAGLPLSGDPVAIRRALFASSDAVVWDHPGSAKTTVEIVEFSDLECPACKAKWPLIEKVIEGNGDRVRHGMVSFPLTGIHPWAFRASSATWCIGEQQAEQLIPFKELFYDLQREMEVGLVTPTSMDFVAGNGLDETSFRSCYLRQPSLDGVHRQLAIGHVVGVNATPTYFVNGWMVQMPQEEWFSDLVARLSRGEEP
ncbi:MAG: thioredoxin domain-containing protein [Thermoanaerobaculales bacterium]|jgi:protein-disulfide isomerase|nr:thioredoxin domain-containing protein [Thermoanaerobaculales bacterium]